MSKLIFSVLIFCFVSNEQLHGQDITGNWQGIVRVDREDSRMVLRISKSDAEGLTGLIYNVDRDGQGIPCGIVFQGSTIKISVPQLRSTFQGRMSAEGDSIVGTWSQESVSRSLTLSRATPGNTWTIPDVPVKTTSTVLNSDPVFEVATVKPSPLGERMSMVTRGGQFNTTYTSLSDLITFAYCVHSRQITDGPVWLEASKFDVAAKFSTPGQPNPQQLRAMVQELLATRFGLVLHRDKKNLSIYALAVAKTGAKLVTNNENPNGSAGVGFQGLGVMVAKNATMADFAGFLQRYVLDRPVVDRTGISGRYDVSLNWAPDEFQFPGRADQFPPAPNSIGNRQDLYTAIQQQAGLRLESTKAITDVLVIDHAEKPSEN
jgi:uncharacterized protein (TIGR03435 family)